MIEINQYCQFKTSEVEERTKCLCPVALNVLNFMAEYCKDRALPFVITDSVSTPEEDIALKRGSATHREARAFDSSIRGWKEEQISDFIREFENRYISIAPISRLTNKPCLIVRHNAGFGDHLHVQVARMFAIANPLKPMERPNQG